MFWCCIQTKVPMSSFGRKKFKCDLAFAWTDSSQRINTVGHFFLPQGKLGFAMSCWEKNNWCDIPDYMRVHRSTFALGQVAVEAQWTDKLKEKDGNGCDNEQHHKHHHPNRCAEGLWEAKEKETLSVSETESMSCRDKQEKEMHKKSNTVEGVEDTKRWWRRQHWGARKKRERVSHREFEETHFHIFHFSLVWELRDGKA